MGLNAQVYVIDMGWNRIQRELKSMKNSYTSIGYFNISGKPSDDIGARAVVQELGARIPVTQKMRWFWFFNFGTMLSKAEIIIPSRPFMRYTFEETKGMFKDQLTKEYNRILDRLQTAKMALSRIGEWYKGRIQTIVKAGVLPVNAPFTVSQKGSSKPLIDTGEMINRIEHRETMK